MNVRINLKFPLLNMSYDNHIIKNEVIRVWEQAPSVLTDINLITKFGFINIKIYWGNYTERILEFLVNDKYTLENYFAGKISQEELNELDALNEYIIVKSKIEVIKNKENKEKLDVYDSRIINYHVENLLIQFFLTMNLSTPGSFDFFDRKLAADSVYRIYDYSATLIEGSWRTALENCWPNIEAIELCKVWGWIDSLDLGSRQMGKNNTERALFSILHLCRENTINPNMLVWISLALEALYDTPRGQINKILLERIFLFLGIPSENKNKLKKKINELYNLRSRFVHGDLDISNPLSNEVLDEDCNNFEAMIMEYCSFGLSIIISTLQKMIQNNWKVLNFKESYYGS